MFMLVSVTMCLINPPVGVCPYLTCRIGKITIGEMWKEPCWFFLAELGVLVFCAISWGYPLEFRR
jgi:TRAP-type C4-dicarboxylate transport system permease large subunit|tara:strand:- start:2361 stop:2555 length:195 start_codon:yes stop_codon:yes gene_type:complete